MDTILINNYKIQNIFNFNLNQKIFSQQFYSEIYCEKNNQKNISSYLNDNEIISLTINNLNLSFVLSYHKILPLDDNSIVIILIGKEQKNG